MQLFLTPSRWVDSACAYFSSHPNLLLIPKYADKLQSYQTPITPSASTGAYITIESISSRNPSESAAYIEVDTAAASRNSVLMNQVYAESNPGNSSYQLQPYVRKFSSPFMIYYDYLEMTVDPAQH